LLFSAKFSPESRRDAVQPEFEEMSDRNRVRWAGASAEARGCGNIAFAVGKFEVAVDAYTNAIKLHALDSKDHDGQITAANGRGAVGTRVGGQCAGGDGSGGDRGAEQDAATRSSIAALPNAVADHPVDELAKCYSNRALAQIKLGWLAPAMCDANAGLAALPVHEGSGATDAHKVLRGKLLYRKALAHQGLGESGEACRAARAAAALGQTRALSKLLAELESTQKKGMGLVASDGSARSDVRHRDPAAKERDFSKPPITTLGDLDGFIYRASPDGADTSLLVLLHGLGDK
jgi:tetratricopeptide (TPR) repeat protein